VNQLDLFSQPSVLLGTEPPSPLKKPPVGLSDLDLDLDASPSAVSKDKAWLEDSLQEELNIWAPQREIFVKQRNNRQTLGSLRSDPQPAGPLHFLVATRLLEENPEDALILGKILMGRYLKQTIPKSWLIRLSSMREAWNDHSAPVQELLPSDDDLAFRMHCLLHYLPELQGKPLPRIYWKDSRSRRVLGRFVPDLHEIQIHHIMAHPKVPDVVLDNLIHHELLHAALGSPVQNGRRRMHTRVFRERERNFPGHQRAESWIKRHFHQLF
jgi:hypothetical protein